MNLLVRRAKKGDKTAFAQLMEEQGPSLYKVAKAILKNDDDVADAMQETALSCWENIGTLRKDELFKTWLIRILINHCNTIYAGRRNLLTDEDLPEAATWENGYEHAEWDEFLNVLDEKYRIVVLLFYVESFKTKEIAQILEISEGTVRVRLSRAREMMRQQYSAGESEGASESRSESGSDKKSKGVSSDELREQNYGGKGRIQKARKGDLYGQI